MPLADPVVLGEGPCVAWGNLLMPGSSSPTCVLVFLAVLKGRGVLRSSVPDGKARRVFRGRGRRGQVGCVTQPFVEGGTGSLVVRQTARRAQRIVRRCSSVQDWDGDGTGPSNEALLWTRGTSSGIVVVVLGWLSLCDKRMRLRAARGNPGTQSEEKVGMNHSRCMPGERMEDQKYDPRSGGGRGHTGESCEGGGGFWCES